MKSANLVVKDSHLILTSIHVYTNYFADIWLTKIKSIHT